MEPHTLEGQQAMKRIRGWTIAALELVVLAGCVQTNVTRLGNAPERQKVAMDQVAVYRTADQVPGKYQEVGLLTSSGSSGFTTEAGMAKNMRFKAGEMGANAIILDATSEPSAGAKVAAAVFLGPLASPERKGRAIAIYILPVAKEP
jgi:hypothetical protein